MDPKIGDYIRENRDKYTREAIREQLIAAGHDPEAVDAELERSAGQYAAPTPPIGWRPRWREFLVLVLLGAIGAAIVWAGEPYGAGGIAPVVYFIVVSIGFAIGKAVSLLVDAGNTLTAAVLLGVAAVGGAVVFGLSLVSQAIAVPAVVMAVLLIYLRGSNPRAAGAVGAAIPLLVWLLVTGTCYSPLLSRLQGV
jgi:hypothetical protein